jgi:hypothetical protein
MAAVRGGEITTMDKVIKIAAGVIIGAIADAIAAEVLREAGVPPHAAKVAGGIIGALV